MSQINHVVREIAAGYLASRWYRNYLTVMVIFSEITGKL